MDFIQVKKKKTNIKKKIIINYLKMKLFYLKLFKDKSISRIYSVVYLTRD
jgi:hypothetical protein